MANQIYTISSPTYPSEALYTAVSNFLSTMNCATSPGATPTPPPGGWSLVETWASGGYTYSTWQSPGADNNVGVTFYLIFQYQTSAQSTTSTFFTVTLCEVYNTSTSTGSSPTRAGTAFNGTAPQVPSATSTPPWAAILTANAVALPTSIGGEQVMPYTPSAGTNNLLIAANKDGFFLSLTNSSGTWSCYFGNAPTMVTNTAAPDTVPLVLISPNAYNGATRDPGPTTASGFGAYSMQVFHPSTAGVDARMVYGVVNGTPASLPEGGDLYAGLQAYPTAFRWQVVKTGVLNGSVGGWLRALLPSWIQVALENATSWGDTVSESGDTLVVVQNFVAYMGYTNFTVSLLINTTVA